MFDIGLAACRCLCFVKHGLFEKCLLWQVWTIAVMFLSKKFKRLPHMFTVNLFLAQVSTLTCSLKWFYLNCSCSCNFKLVNACIFYGVVSSFFLVLGWSCGTLWWKKMTILGRFWLSHYYVPQSTALMCGQVCCVCT